MVFRGVRPMAVAALTLVGGQTVPKVPFSNQPCQSLTAGTNQR